MHIRLFLLVLLIPVFVNAQEKYSYEWEKDRKRYLLSSAEEKAPEIILKEDVEYEYTFEDDQFVMYTVYHRIVRVNTNEAVQRHNRISISMDNTIALVDVKARAINPKNKEVLFDINNLKEIKNDDTDEGTKVFAVEGVELGSEIEYYFVRKMTPVVFSSAYLQMDVPIKRASFVLECPRHLIFDFRSYNGFPDVKSDTTSTKNIYSASMTDIPSSGEEPFAYYLAQRKRIEFKLAYNTAKSRARLYTWDIAGKQFYTTLYNLRKEDEKPLEKFVKELKDDPSKSLPARIRNLERAIKTTIQIEDQRNDESLEQIASIVKYKVASKRGITRLFLYSFMKLGINVQTMITCSREFARFDESFDTWNYLDDYILFFPEPKGFLSPYDQALSYPLVEAEHTSQKGLLIEPIEIGSVRSALATVREIPAPAYDLNTDNLDIIVNFGSDLATNEIRLKREFKGYQAAYIVPYYHVMTEQQKSAMVDEILKQTAPGLTLGKWEGKASFQGEVDQFDLDATFTSSHFIEQAGSRILFKAGLLIGPQSELYNDDKRQIPVENTFNRGYERVIKVNLPAGYSVKNPDDLNFNVIYDNRGSDSPFSFVSTHTIQGNVLTIRVNEYYKEIYAPLDRYEDYRKVINAAADFNKVVLVLEK